LSTVSNLVSLAVIVWVVWCRLYVDGGLQTLAYRDQLQS